MLQYCIMFRASDFDSFVILLTAENVGTKTIAKNTDDSGLLRTSKAPSIVSINDTHIFLKLPSRSCSTGHNLSIDLEIKVSPNSIRFSCTGKVIKLTSISKDMDLITLELMQFEVTEWQEILSIFDRRQREVLDFLDKAVGW